MTVDAAHQHKASSDKIEFLIDLVFPRVAKVMVRGTHDKYSGYKDCRVKARDPHDAAEHQLTSPAAGQRRVR